MADADDTSVLYGSNVYNSIIFSRFDKNEVKDYNSSTRTNEVVDIITDYPWTIDTLKKSTNGGIIDVPHCYVIEYQQRYSSSITNLINSLTAAKNGLGQTVEEVSSVISKVSALVKSLSGVGDSVASVASSVTNGGSGSSGDSGSGSTPAAQPAASGSSTPAAQPAATGSSTPAQQTGDTTRSSRSIRAGEEAAASGQAATPAAVPATPATQTTQPAATPTSTSSTTTSTTSSSSSSGGGGVNQSVLELTEKMKKFYNDIIGSKISQITNPIRDAQGKHFMQPYSLLYDLKATGTKYCFPMLSDPPVLKTHNSFGDGDGDDTSVLSVNSFFSTISSLGSSIPAFGRDLAQLNSFLSGSGNAGELFERTHVEKAKFFQFPTDTDTYTVTFPLINTIPVASGETPMWEKNYKFIMLFCMKNMIFRKDNVAFYPPLFYDLVIPGTIRLPYSYVESIDVQPLGMVRILKGKKMFTFTNEDISIPVPEAWMVTIKFKSLIATSGNLVLSAFADTPVIAASN